MGVVGMDMENLLLEAELGGPVPGPLQCLAMLMIVFGLEASPADTDGASANVPVSALLSCPGARAQAPVCSLVWRCSCCRLAETAGAECHSKLLDEQLICREHLFSIQKIVTGVLQGCPCPWRILPRTSSGHGLLAKHSSGQARYRPPTPR